MLGEMTRKKSVAGNSVQREDTNAINDGVAMALNSTVRRYFRPELGRRTFNFSYMTTLRAAEFFYRGFKFGARVFREESALLRTPSNYHHGGGIQNDNMTP